MIAHRRWTQTDITDLRTRVQGGQIADEIASATQRLREDVAAMMSRLRLR